MRRGVSPRAIRARLVDFEEIVRKHVYHLDFAGSFSLKKVVPALVPDVSYDGLAVADEDNAIAMFARMARGEIDAPPPLACVGHGTLRGLWTGNAEVQTAFAHPPFI